MAEGGVVGVEVHIEGVFVVQGVVLPAKLDVGHLQGVADGLDSIGAGALRWSKDGYHTQCQLVTGCNKVEGNTGVSEVLGTLGVGSDVDNPINTQGKGPEGSWGSG